MAGPIKKVKGFSVDSFTNKKNIRTPGSVIKSPGNGYEFFTGIVEDFISDPDVFLDVTGFRSILIDNSKTDNKSLSNQAPHSYVRNPEHAEIMPRNSIVAYVIDQGMAAAGILPSICYPFFPPHLSFPLKPGEHVWLLKEVSDGSEIFYWLCRKHGTKHTDDVNYTHLERANIVDMMLKSVNENNLTPKTSDLKNACSFVNSNISNLPAGIDNNFILNNSLAYFTEFTGEVVPPVTKKCGDMLLQGSNNSMIHMTTEKFKVSDVHSISAFTKLTDSQIKTNRVPFSPAIDICVARKSAELSMIKDLKSDDASSESIKSISNLRGKGFTTFENYEFNKVRDLEKKGSTQDMTEGFDLSATNCGSRLYMSNDCKVDEVFESGTSIDSSDLEDKQGVALVTYSDNNRMISEKELRLSNKLGESFIDMDEEGNINIKAVKGGASITLKADGNIVITPGDNGVIMLGGDGASQSILGTSAGAALGQVTSPIITSTMGGVVGLGDPSTGMFASKVLIK